MEDIQEAVRNPQQVALDTELHEACTALDLEKVKQLSKNGADLGCQDDATGNGPLHDLVNGASLDTQERALMLLQFLLSNGAVWNQTNRAYETAGCLARKAHLTLLYDHLVSAGVRAELLLTALDKARGVHNAVERNASFLNGHVVYTNPTETSTTLLDEEKNAIMMTWEDEIMKRSAKIVSGPGKAVLNIGFGLGLVDDAIQLEKPERHVIIEAHPDVLREMRRRGWYERPGVEILEGRWQDLVDDLADRETFDGIMYDPFEFWEDMYAFFDAVVALLKPDGTFCFFHGLGADNETFYEVYSQILEIELRDFGLSTSFEELPIATVDAEWEGTKRRYWALERYRLPTCRFLT
ncbi:Arginine N-methyltransferase 2 [Protomyces lactucae-debilis]|uniref:Arginine N-methyltransferase 2 n=1 Tax=Protomyces lactucae-debilis TaxID=2754530 RepID=A0A1Y2EX30_PROLT|nr:Arginine N-methyltransferase 2 [Protomyces lactucae-debilis]ORY75814.1 Arginine N-methyltransferase 2 [Protomyces lactucae-debilis]